MMGIKYIDKTDPTHLYDGPVRTAESIQIVSVSIIPAKCYTIERDELEVTKNAQS